MDRWVFTFARETAICIPPTSNYYSALSKRYFVPDLIPVRYRVLPELFTQSKEVEKKPASPITWIGFIFFFSAAWAILFYSPVFSACLGLFALFFLPPFIGMLERRLRFAFTPGLKRKVFAALLAFSIVPAYKFPEKVRLLGEKLEQERLAEIRQKKLQLERQRYLAKKEELRKEALKQKIETAEQIIRRKKYPNAISLLEEVKTELTPGDDDLKRSVNYGMAEAYSKIGDFTKAIGILNDVLAVPDGQAYYLRAICYQKTHKIEKAVADAYHAGQHGSQEGERLYQRLNPEHKRVVYYQTVCCDGSYSPSNAKGRGACSHHGGVCNWNLPIYETYRKYAVSSL